MDYLQGTHRLQKLLKLLGRSKGDASRKLKFLTPLFIGIIFALVALFRLCPSYCFNLFSCFSYDDTARAIARGTRAISQGQNMVDAIRQIGVSEVTYEGPGASESGTQAKAPDAGKSASARGSDDDSPAHAFGPPAHRRAR